MRTLILLTSAWITLLLSITAFAQSPVTTGTIRGVVRIEPSGTAARNAVITVAELRRSVLTDESGAFEINDMPAGRDQVIAHLHHLPDVGRTVAVAGGIQTVDFQIALVLVREHVTGTATRSP